MAQNPYLLMCLIILHQSSPAGKLPLNPGSLFYRLAEYLWNRERIRQTRGWIPFVEAEALFARLGFKMIEEDRPTSVPRHYANGILGGQDIIHCGVSANILENTGDQIKFYHQLMQDCFAGLHLYRMGSAHLVAQLGSKWSEAVIALCGIVPNPEAIVLDAIKSDVHLAGRCVDSGIAVSNKIRHRIVTKLNQELSSSGKVLVAQENREVFGFVKENLSGAQRRKSAASGERGAGKGGQPLSPPQH